MIGSSEALVVLCNRSVQSGLPLVLDRHVGAVSRVDVEAQVDQQRDRVRLPRGAAHTISPGRDCLARSSTNRIGVANGLQLARLLAELLEARIVGQGIGGAPSVAIATSSLVPEVRVRQAERRRSPQVGSALPAEPVAPCAPAAVPLERTVAGSAILVLTNHRDTTGELPRCP